MQFGKCQQYFFLCFDSFDHPIYATMFIIIIMSGPFIMLANEILVPLQQFSFYVTEPTG